MSFKNIKQILKKKNLIIFKIYNKFENFEIEYSILSYYLVELSLHIILLFYYFKIL